MEKLPDEILIDILSYVSPEDLVHSCHHVCKRWQSLCSSTLVWKYSTVRVSTSELEDLNRLEAVFAYAPVIGEVRIYGTPELRTIVQMVRGCRQVSSLFLKMDRTWVTVLVLLEHYKENLKSLQVLINDELPESLLSIIASISNLKRLVLGDMELSLYKSVDYAPFCKLQNSIASLEHLDISHLCHIVFSHASCPFYDVIRKFHRTLTKLYLPSAPATAGLLEVVSMCTKLKQLEVSYPSDMSPSHVESALCHLNSLRCLNIWICDDADEHFPEFLLRSKLFESLRELEVGFSFPDIDDRIADAIAARCQDLEVLSLPGSGRRKNFSPRGLEKILRQARSLQRLNLCLQTAFSPRLLDVMKEHLPRLEYLDVRDSHLLSERAIRSLQTAFPKLFVRWMGEDLEEYMGFADRHIVVCPYS